jgi:hypothetical protein
MYGEVMHTRGGPTETQDLAGAFTGLALYGFALGPFVTVIGIFSGPPVLNGGIVHLVTAALALVTASGLRRGESWGYFCAYGLGAVVVVCSSWASAYLLSAGAHVAGTFPAAIAGLFLAVILKLAWQRHWS